MGDIVSKLPQLKRSLDELAGIFWKTPAILDDTDRKCQAVSDQYGATCYLNRLWVVKGRVSRDNMDRKFDVVDWVEVIRLYGIVRSEVYEELMPYLLCGANDETG